MASYRSDIPRITTNARARATRVVRKTAAAIEADIKESMAEPKSGRQYGIGDGLVHTASAPGESPAIASSSYAHSIFSVAVDGTASAVGTTDERGPVLELGGGRVAARPHFGPAFERAQEGFESELAQVFEEEE